MRRATSAALESLEGRLLFAAYAVTDLGALGGLRSEAHAINASGQVALDADVTPGSDLSPHSHPALYTGGGLTDLGTLGGADGHAFGINSAGRVVGTASLASGVTHAFLYNGTSKIDLGSLGTGTDSTAYAINDSNVAVGSADVAPGQTHAFRYDGSLHDLGVLGGGAQGVSQGFGVNNAGQVVGDTTVASGDTHAFVTGASGMTDLGVLTGGDYSSARAINANGQIAGEARAASGDIHAFSFNNGTMTDLGALSGFTESTARGINAGGDVVGWSGPSDDPSARAFIYAGGQMRDLNTQLLPGSGWVLNEAFGINDAGQIVGLGTVGGHLHGFLLTPQQTGGADTVPPQATVQADNINTEGGATQTIAVTYTDDTAVDASTIGAGDITVSKNGGTPLTVTGVTLNPASGNAGTIVATYTVSAPGGTWDQADDGTYTVSVEAGEVKDAAGNGVAATGGGFTVSLGQFSGPSATVGAPGSFPSGGTTGTIAVTYADGEKVNAASIGADDITITGPGGPVAVSGVTVAPSTDATTLTATYTFAAPGGAWDASDNGAYTVTVVDSQVFDTVGNSAATTSGQFTVNVAEPKPTVDPSFGGGTVSADFVAEALVTDAEGRIYIAGHQGDPTAGTMQGVLERLNPDGSSDTTFGNNGSVVSPVGGNDANYAIAIDSQGRIYTAGTQGGDFIVNRLRSDGTFDPKFGGRGHAATDMGAADDTAYGLVVLPDGSAVLGGSSNNAFAFAKFTTNGDLDTTFGTGGRATFAVGTSDVIGALALDHQGRIVAAGSSGTNVVALRLTPNGAQDASFGGGNAVVVNALSARTDLGIPDHTVGLALQADDSVLIANRTPAGDFGLVRLTPAGAVDTTFANNGIATADFGGDDDADSIIVQGTGQIFAVGTSDAGGPKTAVAAFTANGQLDTTFATGGKFTVDAGVSTTGRALHVGSLLLRAFGGLEPNGQLVVATRNGSPSATATPLRRLNVPGSGTVGQFGTVNGKNKKLSFAEADGTAVTISLKGGTGTAFYDGTSVDLVLSGTSARSALAVKGRGGSDGRVRLRDIRADGGLKSFVCNNADVTGTFFVNGPIGKVSLGTLSGTLAATGSIGGLSTTGGLSSAMVLAGANLGTDGKLGGGDDTFGPASIGRIAVKGAVATSVVEAGVNPTNGVFGDSNDQLTGAGSTIRSILVKSGTDPQSRFIAGSIGKAKLPENAVPGSDPRLKVLT